LPKLGLVAHVDTSPDAPGGPVRPLLHHDYDGSVIALPGDASVTLDPDRQPALLEHLGHTLITSDGTTLLGSDDKAGCAAIMAAVTLLLESDAPRPELRILFTVDEEVGRGTDHLDLDRFGADVAYTVDGTTVGQIDDETFCAAEATVRFTGRVVHPGYAHGVMVNAVRAAAAFVDALPADEQPETTKGRAGYVYAHTLHADTGEATVRVLLRDFDPDGIERRETLVRDGAAAAAERFGAMVAVEVAEQYRNLREYVERDEPRAVPFALEAAREIGLEPTRHAIRGGTDGARLSALGIPTPNVFTGGHDFHSRFEWNTVENLETTVRFLTALVGRWGRAGAV
jgi:tripeptide aminopeptidase